MGRKKKVMTEEFNEDMNMDYIDLDETKMDLDDDLFDDEDDFYYEEPFGWDS
jgi:hypothetical protein